MKIYKFPVGINQTNCYFLVDEPGNKCAIIDPGDEAEKLLKKLSDKELEPVYIIMTHGHFDHIMALDELRDRLHVPAVIHEYDNELLTDARKSLMIWAGRNEGCRPADILVADGDKIRIGDSVITVMHTPGHTPGSICLLCGSDIISGDTLFKGNIGRYDLYGGDYDSILSSLRKISELDGNYKIYPGHGDTTTLNFEKENNIYLR